LTRGVKQERKNRCTRCWSTRGGKKALHTIPLMLGWESAEECASRTNAVPSSRKKKKCEPWLFGVVKRKKTRERRNFTA